MSKKQRKARKVRVSNDRAWSKRFKELVSKFVTKQNKE